MNTSIVASGVKQDIGCRVILWDEKDGFSFYKTGKLTKRNSSYEKLQNEIDTFVIHHSVTYRASHTYNGLVGRGLSVNFIIDDDCNENGFATIYQCADIKDACWSHSPLNSKGAGVEICYHPTFWVDSTLYSETNQKKYKVPPHDVVESPFHGITKKVFAPTEAQLKSLTALLAGYCKLFPASIKPDMPRNEKGEIITTVTDKWSGYILAHMQITLNKIDPLGIKFEDLIHEVCELMPQLPDPQVEPGILKKLLEKAKKIFQ